MKEKPGQSRSWEQKTLPPSLEEAIGPDWAAEEIGFVDFGDSRLSRRCAMLLEDFFAQPMSSIPQACEAINKTKAAYEFFDNSSVEWQKTLLGHRKKTQQRMAEHSTILAVQDTTSLNFSTHPATGGIGPINRKKDLGLMLHNTLAFTTDGVALGLVEVQCWARDPLEFGKKKTRQQRSIQDKESQKWLGSLQVCQQLQEHLSPTRLVSIGDREADIYGLFQLAAETPQGPHLLIRAMHNRKLSASELKLWDWMKGQPVADLYTLTIPRKGKQAPRPASLQVRYAPVRLQPPRSGKAGGPPMALWAIGAQELNPPPRAKPVSWMLLTTLPVTTVAQALEKIHWYTIRWQIELFHKILKSGCQAEKRQLEQKERLQRCLILDMIVAWRIQLLIKLGREVPDLPASVAFEMAEWQALYCFIHKTTQLPEQEPTLNEAIRWVAKLGGFLGRKQDGHPGSLTLWRGLHRLHDIVEAWKIFRPP